MQEIAIYGAKALALGMYEAIHFLYPECQCIGFVVSSIKDNPCTLAGLKVWELVELKIRLSAKQREKLQILIATPEDIHTEIISYLIKNGFVNYICMDSRKEARLMGKYYAKREMFPSINKLTAGQYRAHICVYQAKFYKDKQLLSEYSLPEWITPLQVGTELTEERIAKYCDNTGENISTKNVNYCELTALYWIWKNRLQIVHDIYGIEYYGLFHYRRLLDIAEEDLMRLKVNDVDVVLPYPTIHEPDISEHHARYVKETDWQAMLQALEELQPDYARNFAEILSQKYFYNYNLLIAKKSVLADYCAWLFPVLKRTEELSMPKGWERADRYIGYLGENLMTLYFLYHKNLKIYHAGRLMLK